MFVRRIPVPVGAAAQDSQLAAAAGPAGGAGADHRWRSRGRCFGAPTRRSAPGAGAREVVVLLDTSYSMGYGDRWERARAAARNAVIGQLGAADRGSVVLFSSGAEIAAALDRRSASALNGADRRGEAGRRRDALRAGAEGGRQHPRRVDAAAARGGADQRLPARRLARRGRRAAAARARRSRRCRCSGAADSRTSRVTAVSLARSTFSNQERVAVTAGVVNRTRAAGVRQHARAGGRRPRRCSRSRSTSSRGGIDVGHVRCRSP